MENQKDKKSKFDPKSYRENYRRNKLELKLCTACDNLAVEGLTYCRNCADKMRQREKERRDYCKKFKICIRCGKTSNTKKLRCETCSDKANETQRKHQKLSKTTVMTHYGKNEKLQCCWDECQVTDIDMLTLDHVENNGAKHRREYTRSGRGGGAMLYNKLIRDGFPEGYQTLCANHNLKKHIISLKGG